MLRFDSACVCEQSYPYLLGDMHPSGRVRIQTMATARTQPRIIKAGEVVDPRRAAALDPHYNWEARARGARPARGRLRRAGKLSPPARISAGARAPGARPFGSRRDALLRLHNIRYLSSTVIGEWARDKMIRFALLAVRPRRALRLGLRLCREASPVVLAVAAALLLPGRDARTAWRDTARSWTVADARGGDKVSAQGARCRADAARP